MVRLRNRFGDRRIKALLIVLGLGVSGVFVDLDHILCMVLNPEISVEAIGCRLLHPYLLPVSGFLLLVAGALGFGLWGYLVGDSIGRKPGTN